MRGTISMTVMSVQKWFASLGETIYSKQKIQITDVTAFKKDPCTRYSD